MTDQMPVPDGGTPGRRSGRSRARALVAGQLAKRRTVALVGVLLLLAVVATAALAPGTSSGFDAVIGSSSNSAGTAPNFSPSGGVLPFDDSWAGGDSGWNDYGGSWTTATAASGATYTETAGGASGNKAVSGQASWTDYTVQGDVKITSGTQAGLVFRVQNPTVGADALNGYYLGLYTSGTLTLGRQNNGYAALKSVAYPTSAGTWYHLTVQVVGCVITASALQVGSSSGTVPTTLAYTDTGCPPPARSACATSAARPASATSRRRPAGRPRPRSPPTWRPSRTSCCPRAAGRAMAGSGRPPAPTRRTATSPAAAARSRSRASRRGATTR
ncbi:family 16 glycoside hydrolase [Frondihabitans sucicola]|uniref:family 16 glycoside hydrolase n=1 Tax=Frondihabitans sucicola TaxID=1268041 RepID=UPI002572B8F4|nr:family 16 glycoside hydrolase [Frondihabitans sucicola]